MVGLFESWTDAWRVLLVTVALMAAMATYVLVGVFIAS